MKERRSKGIIRFIKDWTLPVAMGLGTVIYLVFGLIPQLEEAAVFFDPIFDTILPMFMFLILFVTFCKVDFHKLRPVAWHFWICVFQLLFIGALMGIILLPSAISPDALILMEAILMCIISPCAAAAAVVTQKLGGSLEQMTTYTFISNFITAMMVPICFPLIEKGADMTFWTAFSKILYEVAIVLLVPMLLAYIVKHHAQQLHKRIISVKDLSYYLWADDCHWHDGEEYRPCQYDDRTPDGYCLHGSSDVCGAVCRRPFHRTLLQSHTRSRSGSRTEKHGFCHMDGLYVSESVIVGGTGMLYPLAEHRQ